MGDIGQAIQAKEDLDNSNFDDKIIINILYLDQKDFYLQLQNQSIFNTNWEIPQFKSDNQYFRQSTTPSFENNFFSSLSPATLFEYHSSSQSDPNAKFYQDKSPGKLLINHKIS